MAPQEIRDERTSPGRKALIVLTARRSRVLNWLPIVDAFRAFAACPPPEARGDNDVSSDSSFCGVPSSSWLNALSASWLERPCIDTPGAAGITLLLLCGPYT